MIKSHLLFGHTKTCGHPKDGMVIYTKMENIYEGEFTISRKIFYIDIKNYEKIKEMRLCIKDNAKTDYIIVNEGSKQMPLHRVILGIESKSYPLVDHVDGNGLNNLESNLRICTRQENAFNHRKFSTNTSGFIGVQKNKNGKSWDARITYFGKNICGGTYADKTDAIKKRLELEKKYFGEYAPQSYLFEEYGI